MYHFIVNPKSRSGKGINVWEQLHKELQKRSVSFTFHLTEYAGHARKLAAVLTAAPEENCILIAVGGDGTVNEVLCGISDFKRVIFGVIPVGSGNDYCRGLKLHSDPLKALLHILEAPELSYIDLGAVRWETSEKEHLFSISCGMGMDAFVCKKALTSRSKTILNKLGLGKLTYLILTVSTLFSMKPCDFSVSMINGETLQFPKAIFLAAMNFRTEGGGVPMAPNADASDGKIDLCIAYGIPKWKTFFLLPFLVCARHEKFECFKIIRCPSCSVQSSLPMAVHTDGEYMGSFHNAEFFCLPEKLHIIR